jgi:flagellar assembly protein FliH
MAKFRIYRPGVVPVSDVELSQEEFLKAASAAPAGDDAADGGIGGSDGGAGSAGKGMSPAELKEAERASQEMLAEAEAEKERLLEEARAEAEQIKKDAEEKGYNDGYQQGLVDGEDAAEKKANAIYRERIDQWETAVAGAIDGIQKERKESFQRYLEELKDVVLTIAEKVIHVSLGTSGEVIKKMIVTEVEKLHKTEWIKIYIDKVDYDRLVEVDEDVARELYRVSDNIKFVVMDKEQSGYVVIETPQEMIDIGVDTQLENVKEAVKSVPLGTEES